MDFRDDYVECLHHRKEVCRLYVCMCVCSCMVHAFVLDPFIIQPPHPPTHAPHPQYARAQAIEKERVRAASGEGNDPDGGHGGGGH